MRWCIALLGRLHDTPAPLNARLTGLSARLVADGNGAGGMSEAELEAVFANG